MRLNSCEVFVPADFLHHCTLLKHLPTYLGTAYRRRRRRRRYNCKNFTSGEKRETTLQTILFKIIVSTRPL